MKHLPYLALFLLLGGCKGCCHDEACMPGYLRYRLTGFDTAELRPPVYIIRYDTTGFFAQVHDTTYTDFTIDSTSRLGFVDTILSTSPGGANNYEIWFPVINKRVRIYGLTYNKRSERVCNGAFGKPLLCTTPIITYIRDSVRLTADTTQYGFSEATIVR